MTIPRDEIALRILCALITKYGVHTDSVGRNDVAIAFAVAQEFQRVCNELRSEELESIRPRQRQPENEPQSG